VGTDNCLLDRFFRLSENQTRARMEVLAGVTTFLTMAYIIFVQPAALSGAMFGKPTGMDFGAVTAATCLSAALGTSTVTSFNESAAGVEQGGRTGLTGLVVAALFLLALFFSPLIAMVGQLPAHYRSGAGDRRRHDDSECGEG
jgi:xanthine/uracil/vitamin C permease (AzgA family)